LDDDTKLEIVRIAGKRFFMGSPENEVDRQEDEGPQHRVEIRSFGMGKYPVTQEQWWVVATKFPKIKRDLEPEPSSFKGDRRPVERVSWYDAIEFCDRLSRKTKKTYRLPSEAEWEYACRAGTTTPFHFGDTITPEFANLNRTYNGTTDAGKFQPNAFGLYDMHGNVWEWCADHWQGNYQGAPIDGSAWLTDNQEAGRLMRGGSWIDNPSYCRSTYRDYYDPDDRNLNLGFRVVCVSA
jgi:formylglycine-generating enzyme required for sulfatase activity